MNEFEKMMLQNRPKECEKCGSKMKYIASGVYQCSNCSHEMLDDYGKVKEFLEKNGPAPMIVIRQATGVPTEAIEMFLKEGRVEIPDGSGYYMKCEKCGCAIRFGRFCPECAKVITGDIRNAFLQDVGERPKYNPNSEMAGRMHYLNRRNK